MALLTMMQDRDARPKGDLETRLARLDVELLLLYEVAVEGGGRGVEPDHRTDVWVRLVAEHWRDRLGEEPAEKGGRFFNALQAFGEGRALLPLLTADNVSGAVKRWKALRLA